MSGHALPGHVTTTGPPQGVHGDAGGDAPVGAPAGKSIAFLREGCGEADFSAAAAVEAQWPRDDAALQVRGRDILKIAQSLHLGSLTNLQSSSVTIACV